MVKVKPSSAEACDGLDTCEGGEVVVVAEGVVVDTVSFEGDVPLLAAQTISVYILGQTQRIPEDAVPVEKLIVGVAA